jgi:hypothetical protein
MADPGNWSASYLHGPGCAVSQCSLNIDVVQIYICVTGLVNTSKYMHVFIFSTFGIIIIIYILQKYYYIYIFD